MLFYYAQQSNLIIVFKISLITSWTQIKFINLNKTKNINFKPQKKKKKKNQF